MRRTVLSSIFTVALTVGGLASVSPVVAQASPAERATASETLTWIDAGGKEQFISARRQDGVIITIYHGTTYRMICYWDEPPGGARKFYGEFRSGKYKGQYGDVIATAVRNQSKVHHCD